MKQSKPQRYPRTKVSRPIAKPAPKPKAKPKAKTGVEGFGSITTPGGKQFNPLSGKTYKK